MNKTTLNSLWFLLAGLGIGILAYGVFKAIFTQAPPPAVPHYMMRPEPPEEKVGYQFDMFISTPSLEAPLDFSLDPSGSLFFILDEKFYFIGLTTPIISEAEIPQQLDGSTIGTVTSADWAPDIPVDSFTVYLGTNTGVYQWVVPTSQPEPKEDVLKDLAKKFTDGFTEESRLAAIRFFGGKLFAVDSGAAELRVYDQKSGELIQTVNLSALDPPCGNRLNIYIHSDGSDYTVWIADRKNYRFVPIRSDGQCDVSRIWGQRGKTLESFQGQDAPLHFIIEPDGAFIVTENLYPYVKKFRPDGTFECIVAGDRAFNWSKSDRLFVASFEGKVYILSPNTNNILQFSPKL
ncbi:MAG: hypothetical protein IJH67_07880 [Thermoguttaceae bacterium]|nr:hypothetical protein [Thermoguttaceae bacterium]